MKTELRQIIEEKKPGQNHFSRRSFFALFLFFPILFTLSISGLWLTPACAQTSGLIERATKLWKSGQAEQAATLLNTPADQGNLQAQLLIGRIREQSGTAENLLKARNWYARGALNEYPPAQIRLSQVLRSPWLAEATLLPSTPLNTAILAGQTSNSEAANYWLQRAAHLDNAEAQYLLAQHYEAQQKTSDALFWYEKAVQQNYPPALNTYAVLLWQGQQVNRDTARAAQLYQQAAQQGYAPAMFNLAGLIAQHQVEGDASNVIQWLRQSAQLGYGKAQLQLGYQLLQGDQIEQNEREAAKMFYAAAQQGLGWAQYYLAIQLQQGRGVNRNLDASREWFERAANANIAPAQYELALIYLNGLSIASDSVKARKLLQQAADSGLPEAKRKLAQLDTPTHSTSSPSTTP